MANCVWAARSILGPLPVRDIAIEGALVSLWLPTALAKGVGHSSQAYAWDIIGLANAPRVLLDLDGETQPQGSEVERVIPRLTTGAAYKSDNFESAYL